MVLLRSAAVGESSMLVMFAGPVAAPRGLNNSIARANSKGSRRDPGSFAASFRVLLRRCSGAAATTSSLTATGVSLSSWSTDWRLSPVRSASESSISCRNTPLGRSCKLGSASLLSRALPSRVLGSV